MIETGFPVKAGVSEIPEVQASNLVGYSVGRPLRFSTPMGFRAYPRMAHALRQKAL